MGIIILIVVNIQKKSTMRDKKPTNEQRRPHGHWVVYYAPSSDEVWFECNYVNGVEFGYIMTTTPSGKREKSHQYYAR